MSHPRRVTFSYSQAVGHANEVWRRIVAHVHSCEKNCRLAEGPDGYKLIIPRPDCDWGQAFAEEWSIAAKRCDEILNPARGGSAPPTQGVIHEERREAKSNQ